MKNIFTKELKSLRNTKALYQLSFQPNDSLQILGSSNNTKCKIVLQRGIVRWKCPQKIELFQEKVRIKEITKVIKRTRIMNICQVLDHEADFGGITGWCRALVGTKCFPIDQQVCLLVRFYLAYLA